MSMVARGILLTEPFDLLQVIVSLVLGCGRQDRRWKTWANDPCPNHGNIPQKSQHTSLKTKSPKNGALLQKYLGGNGGSDRD